MTFQISQYLPAKRKQSPSGWISFNAVCCAHRGERIDKRSRGGVLIQTDGSFTYHCFNCGFKASYHSTEQLSHKCRQLFNWLGVDEETINRLNLESIRNRSLVGRIQHSKPKFIPKFELTTLPEGSELINPHDPDHERFVDYLHSRSVNINEHKYYLTTDGKSRNKNRIIIPFTHDNRLVGYTSRFIDGRSPKYIHQHPTGYVFGIDHQQKDWQYVVIVEGVFDAILTRSVATLHNGISDNQAELINGLNKQVIVVPDRDRAGRKVIDRAVELGWAVSFPEWDTDIKDCADAVKRYGRLTTLISIVESAEKSRLKIELRGKGLHD